MKSGLFLLVSFVAGIAVGLAHLIPQSFQYGDVELYILYVLLFLVGISIGGDSIALKNFSHINLRTLLVPAAITVGSLAGAGILSFFMSSINLRDGLAVGAGFGYYSLSSVLITQMRGEELGVIALLSNILREVTTIFLAPLYVRFFGNLALIASAGATAMDVTLPIIQKHSGTAYAVVAVISGIILSIIMPFLVTFILI